MEPIRMTPTKTGVSHSKRYREGVDDEPEIVAYSPPVHRSRLDVKRSPAHARGRHDTNSDKEVPEPTKQDRRKLPTHETDESTTPESETESLRAMDSTGGIMASYIHRFRTADPTPSHERTSHSDPLKHDFWWKQKEVRKNSVDQTSTDQIEIDDSNSSVSLSSSQHQQRNSSLHSLKDRMRHGREEVSPSPPPTSQQATSAETKKTKEKVLKHRQREEYFDGDENESEEESDHDGSSLEEDRSDEEERNDQDEYDLDLRASMLLKEADEILMKGSKSAQPLSSRSSPPPVSSPRNIPSNVLTERPRNHNIVQSRSRSLGSLDIDNHHPLLCNDVQEHIEVVREGVEAISLEDVSRYLPIGAQDYKDSDEGNQTLHEDGQEDDGEDQINSSINKDPKSDVNGTVDRHERHEEIHPSRPITPPLSPPQRSSSPPPRTGSSPSKKSSPTSPTSSFSRCSLDPPSTVDARVKPRVEPSVEPSEESLPKQSSPHEPIFQLDEADDSEASTTDTESPEDYESDVDTEITYSLIDLSIGYFLGDNSLAKLPMFASHMSISESINDELNTDSHKLLDPISAKKENEDKEPAVTLKVVPPPQSPFSPLLSNPKAQLPSPPPPFSGDRNLKRDRSKDGISMLEGAMQTPQGKLNMLASASLGGSVLDIPQPSPLKNRKHDVEERERRKELIVTNATDKVSGNVSGTSESSSPLDQCLMFGDSSQSKPSPVSKPSKPISPSSPPPFKQDQESEEELERRARILEEELERRARILEEELKRRKDAKTKPFK